MSATSTLFLGEPTRLAPPTRRERRLERRALVRQDLRSARLAELVTIREVLGCAAELVEQGWLQEAWFSYRAPAGDVRVSHVPDRHRIRTAPVLSRCLVAAIMDAANAPSSSDGQVTRRTVEVTWHALQSSWAEPVQWCPAPDMHLTHVRDLTRWNDRPGRTSAEIGTLLEAAVGVTDAERRRAMG
ncbi:MAG: DUF6197 family protein [Marmoricola sp.]